MPGKKSLLDDLIILPGWYSLALAAVVYFGLKYYLPTIEFKNPAFQGIGKVFSNVAGMFSSIFVFTAAIAMVHGVRRAIVSAKIWGVMYCSVAGVPAVRFRWQ